MTYLILLALSAIALIAVSAWLITIGRNGSVHVARRITRY